MSNTSTELMQLGDRQEMQLVESSSHDIQVRKKQSLSELTYKSVISDTNCREIFSQDDLTQLIDFINKPFTERGKFINDEEYKTAQQIRWGLNHLVPVSVISSPAYGTKFLLSIIEFDTTDFSSAIIIVYMTEEYYSQNSKIKELIRTDLKDRLAKRNSTEIKFANLKCSQTLIESLTSTYLSDGEALSSVDTEATDFKEIVHKVLTDYPATSDVHFEVAISKGSTAVRIRDDGDLFVYQDYAFQELKDIISIAYNIIGGDRESGSTIQGNNLSFTKPQSGKFRYSYKNRNIEMRVEFVPRTTEQGGDLVCRITSDGKTVEIRSLDTNGYHPIQAALIKKHALKKQGNILFAGVTGSGKSQSAYSSISYMQEHYQGIRKILTAENPVELRLSGTTQVNLEDNTDASDDEANTLSEQFNRVAQSFWRADPDIIFSGEIRSEESAEFALEAARTGHLCLSTIHTAATTDVPSRFDSFNINRNVYQSSSSLTCLVAQSLVRTVCKSCGRKYDEMGKDSPLVYKTLQKLAKLELLQYLGEIRFANKGGCEDCNYSPDGRKGRTLVAEVLEADKFIRQHWVDDEDDLAKKHWLENGGFTKLEHAIYKLCKGELDIEIIESEIEEIVDSRRIREELGVAPYQPEI